MPAGAPRRLGEACLYWIAAKPPRPGLEAQRGRLRTLGEAMAEALRGTDDAFSARLIVAFSGLQLFELPETLLDAACAAAARCPDPLLRSACQSALSWHLMQAGRAAEASQHAEGGLAALGAAPTPPTPPALTEPTALNPLNALQPGALALRSNALRHAVRQRWLDDAPVETLMPLLDEAEAAARGAGDWAHAAQACALRTALAEASGAPIDDLRRMHTLSIDAASLWGDRDASCGARYGLAAAELAQGDLAAAAALLAPVADEARALGNERLLAQATEALSEALSRQHRWPEALAAVRESLALSTRIGLRRTTAASLLWHAPRILARLGRGPDAMRVLSFGEALHVRGARAMPDSDAEMLRQLRRLTASRVPPDEHERCRAEGLALTETQAVALVVGD
jgi:tetratricopeptide (TPR) repeat protein